VAENSRKNRSTATEDADEMIDTPDALHELPIDADVITLDQSKLGTVREIQGECFKVNAPWEPDYWLPLSCVSTATGDRVLLSFNKNRLDDYKLSEPRAA
jgi:hypothetical protein